MLTKSQESLWNIDVGESMPVPSLEESQSTALTLSCLMEYDLKHASEDTYFHRYLMASGCRRVTSGIIGLQTWCPRVFCLKGDMLKPTTRSSIRHHPQEHGVEIQRVVSNFVN